MASIAVSKQCKGILCVLKCINWAQRWKYYSVVVFYENWFHIILKNTDMVIVIRTITVGIKTWKFIVHNKQNTWPEIHFEFFLSKEYNYT